MNKNIDLSKSGIFPIGEPMPEMYSKYFVGQAYLNMLSTQGVGIWW